MRLLTLITAVFDLLTALANLLERFSWVLF